MENDKLVTLLVMLLPVAYIVTTWIYGLLFLSEDEAQYRKRAQVSLIATLVFHTVVLAVITSVYHRCPVATPSEGLIVGSWLLALVHAVSERVTRTISLGVFGLFPAAVCSVLAASLYDNAFALPEHLHNSMFIFHMLGAFVAYICLSFMTVVASMYLLLHRKLKQKTFDVAFRKLPPLEKLDHLCVMWSVIGSVVMVVAYMIGWRWSMGQPEHAIQFTDHLLLFLALAVFLLAALARGVFGVSGAPLYLFRPRRLFPDARISVCGAWVPVDLCRINVQKNPSTPWCWA